MANSLNINTLPEYIEAHRDELIVKAIAGSKTLDYIELMPGVKHKDALNYLDSTVVLADGSQCGWNPAGDDTFTQGYIEVKPVSVQKEFCQREMQEKYMNHSLNFEAGRETLPFEEKIAQSNMTAIQNAVEDLIWNGNSALTISGLFADIDAASASTVAVAFNSGETMSEKIDAVVAAIPFGAFKDGLVNVFVSWTDYRKYIAEQNGTCCANRPIIDAASKDIAYAGDSRVRIVPVLGLEGKGRIVAAPKDALVYGTDIEGSENVYEMFFDRKEAKFCFNVLFNAGTAVKLPWLVVDGK